jgi:hypothetical protein
MVHSFDILYFSVSRHVIEFDLPKIVRLHKLLRVSCSSFLSGEYHLSLLTAQAHRLFNHEDREIKSSMEIAALLDLFRATCLSSSTVYHNSRRSP